VTDFYSIKAAFGLWLLALGSWLLANQRKHLPRRHGDTEIHGEDQNQNPGKTLQPKPKAKIFNLKGREGTPSIGDRLQVTHHGGLAAGDREKPQNQNQASLTAEGTEGHGGEARAQSQNQESKLS
jgi:hypothetical protein